MPQPKNTALRLLVPAIVIVVGIGVFFSILKSTRNPPGSAASAPAPATTPPSPAAPQPAAPASAGQQSPAETTASGNQPSAAQPPAPPPPASQSTPATASVPTGYHVVAVQSGPAPSLGNLDPTGQYKAEIEFSTAGSGVGAIWLTDHVEVIRKSKQQQVPKEQHVQAQRSHSVQVVTDKDGTNVLVVYVVDGQVGSGLLNGKEFPSSRLRVSSGLLEVLDDKGAVGRTIDISTVPVSVLVPFAALAIEVTPPGGQGVIVPLAGTNVWQSSADKPGRFEVVIADDAGTPVLRLTREYSLAPGSLDVVLTQNVTNLSPEALSVRYYEAGPVDLPQDALGYGGDKRRVRFGFLLPKTKDPTQAEVIATDYVLPRAQVLGKREAILQEVTLWPDDRAKNDGFTAVWGGMTNRYFGVAAHPMCDPAATGASKTLDWVDKVSRVVLDGGPGSETLGLRLESKPLTLAGAGKPGAAANFTHGFFVGPLDRSEVDTEPLLKSLRISGLVVFNFGGPCGFCTFVPISEGLLWILHTLHDKVFHDWSLAIIFLVLIVRSCLHPVTKWSQVKMARFGKQMAAIGPKQKIIQEKYKDDPLKLREETSKLWREEGISPAGLLGCVPMFLQTPVWIALYAVLYFSVEMRNQPAFYGLFQHIQPAWPTWQFLGNLSEADRLIYFGHTVATVPILGPIQSINVLPILLAVVFFIQQKYLTPPTAATMTPEQEFQQKMMKWMTVFMFPVFMYNAPSGLAIYFICNSTFAILESKYIRSHMAKYDMLNVEKMKAQRQAAGVGTSMWDRKAKPKKQGLIDRLRELAEVQQKEARKRTGLPPGGKSKP